MAVAHQLLIELCQPLLATPLRNPFVNNNNNIVGNGKRHFGKANDFPLWEHFNFPCPVRKINTKFETNCQKSS